MPRAEYTNMSHARLRFWKFRKLGNHIKCEWVTLHLRERLSSSTARWKLEFKQDAYRRWMERLVRVILWQRPDAGRTEITVAPRAAAI